VNQHHIIIFHWQSEWRSLEFSLIGKRHVVIRHVTSNSSLSFKARALKFCIQTPQVNSKNLPGDIWNFVLGLSYVVFSRLSQSRQATVCPLWGVCVQNFSYIASKLREEIEVTEGIHVSSKYGQCLKCHSRGIFSSHRYSCIVMHFSAKNALFGEPSWW